MTPSLSLHRVPHRPGRRCGIGPIPAGIGVQFARQNAAWTGRSDATRTVHRRLNQHSSRKVHPCCILPEPAHGSVMIARPYSGPTAAQCKDALPGRLRRCQLRLKAGSHEQIILTGQTGTGKRLRFWQAAIHRMPRLFEDMAMARLDGRFPRLVDKLARAVHASLIHLLESLRNQRRSTIMPNSPYQAGMKLQSQTQSLPALSFNAHRMPAAHQPEKEIIQNET